MINHPCFRRTEEVTPPCLACGIYLNVTVLGHLEVQSWEMSASHTHPREWKGGGKRKEGWWNTGGGSPNAASEAEERRRPSGVE